MIRKQFNYAFITGAAGLLGPVFAEALAEKNIIPAQAKILIMGVTFKENCPDTRNSKAFDLIKFFQLKKIHVDAFDPHADIEHIKEEHNFDMLSKISKSKLLRYQGIIFTVAHKEFKDINLKLSSKRVIYDIKSFLKLSDVSL